MFNWKQFDVLHREGDFVFGENIINMEGGERMYQKECFKKTRMWTVYREAIEKAFFSFDSHWQMKRTHEKSQDKYSIR